MKKSEYPKFAGKWKASKPLVSEARTAVVSGNPMPATPPRSSSGADSGFAPKIDPSKYTSTEMIGIGVVHKSGLQPVFSSEQAEDLAKMRR